MVNPRYILLCIVLLLHCRYSPAQAILPDSSRQHPSDSLVKKGLKESARADMQAAGQHRQPQQVTDTIAKTGIKDTAKAPRELTVAELQKLYPPDLMNTLIYDFFATANGLYYENSRTSDQRNEFNFQYNITINNTLQVKKFTIRFYLYNEYSVRYIVDSIATKGLDGMQVRYTLQRQIRKKLNMQGNFGVKSQLWPTYQYRKAANSDAVEKYMYTDYFSPGYITYTCGLSYSFLDNATVNLGLAGGRTTKVKNTNLYASRRVVRLYGTDTGSNRLITYGMNLQLNVPPQMLNKHFGWECNAMLYADRKQLGRLAGYSFDVQNTLHYVFLKHLRVSLKSSLQYDETINNKIFMMNALLVGFYLSNRI